MRGFPLGGADRRKWTRQVPPQTILLSRILSLGAVLAVAPLTGLRAADWPTYLGDKGSSHFSDLAQINTTNADQLEVAWIWNAGDARGNRTQIQCNPLIIDGVMYATTPSLDLVALDAASGSLLWRYQTKEPTGVNRGIAWWEEGNDRRILIGCGQWLQAVDADSGELITGFGNDGYVDLAENLGTDVKGFAVQANSPGAVYGDLIIMGMRLGEGPGPAAPGPIRAYSVRTGNLEWAFNTIPRPGEPNYETWPEDAWKTVGGANAWAGMTIDEDRGIVYAPTGSAAFDFWGGNRVGDNLYANCLLALKAETGELLWYQQIVRHDLWDRDLPAPPTLCQVTHDGETIDAIAQVTKQGTVFVFDRETGESLFPIIDVPVPSSDLAGEVAATIQPFPVKPAPFSRQHFTPDLITRRTPEAHRAVLERYARLRPHVAYQPPSVEGTIIFPGFDGGAEWGGAAVDPDGILYVNSSEMANVLKMRETGEVGSRGEAVYLQNCVGCHGAEFEGTPAAGIPSLVGLTERQSREETMNIITNGLRVMPPWGFLPEGEREAVAGWIRGESEEPAGRKGGDGEGDWTVYVPDEVTVQYDPPPYTHTGYNKFLDPDGYPAVAPPWGLLHAIDLNSGEFRWSVTLGEYPELIAQGMEPTGTENYGGPVVTAGGVIFIASTRDALFRVFDAATGEELWRHQLPAAGFATPATYEVEGRQYVVIAAGGGKMGLPSGDAYVAFALPEN